jgi:hypothetical protein
MLFLLLLALVTQVPCAPNDSSVVCHCKQGQRSACVALRTTDPRQADEIERQIVQAAKLVAAARAQQAAEEEASSAAPEPPDCRGQNHHAISRPIARELEQHKTLRGLYKPRDPRFVAQARSEEDHCGYQDWHRKVDEQVINWLSENKQATPEEFEEMLRELYNRPDLKARFPRGFRTPD